MMLRVDFRISGVLQRGNMVFKHTMQQNSLPVGCTDLVHPLVESESVVSMVFFQYKQSKKTNQNHLVIQSDLLGMVK